MGDGETKSGDAGTTYTQAFGEALLREAREDVRIVAITAAMAQGTGLDRFEAELPGSFLRRRHRRGARRRRSLAVSPWPA